MFSGDRALFFPAALPDFFRKNTDTRPRPSTLLKRLRVRDRGRDTKFKCRCTPRIALRAWEIAVYFWHVPGRNAQRSLAGAAGAGNSERRGVFLAATLRFLRSLGSKIERSRKHCSRPASEFLCRISRTCFGRDPLVENVGSLAMRISEINQRT